MADEATLIFETGPAIPFTVADGTGIEKGTILQLTDPMTASAADGGTVGDPIAGIARTEKIASDGKTKLGVYREGIFKLTASGSIAVGDPLCTCVGDTNPNRVEKATTNEEDLLGTAFETATDGETFLAELNPRGVSLV